MDIWNIRSLLSRISVILFLGLEYNVITLWLISPPDLYLSSTDVLGIITSFLCIWLILSSVFQSTLMKPYIKNKVIISVPLCFLWSLWRSSDAFKNTDWEGTSCWRILREVTFLCIQRKGRSGSVVGFESSGRSTETSFHQIYSLVIYSKIKQVYVKPIL